MPKFDAGEKVESLEYDFTKYRPDPAAPGLSDEEKADRLRIAQLPWAGEITEPPDDKIEALFNVVLPSMRLEMIELGEALDQEQRASRLEWWRDQDHPEGTEEPAEGELNTLDIPMSLIRVEQEEAQRRNAALRAAQRKRTVAALADFCGGYPPVEVLDVLPWRALQHFLGWVTGQFRPETLAAAING
jgi:hypothetical protein